MLKFNNVSFSYRESGHTKKIFNRINLTLKNGEIVAVMGESGRGKTTLLQLAAGFLTPTDGKIERDFDRVSYAFQEPRLFPWMTVEENIFAVLSDKNDKKAVQNALKAVELEDARKLYPSQLSGGMKSRASLARALAYGGELFLLDEPFAALDDDMRRRILLRLRKYLKESGRSGILVTHQKEDAKHFADRIVVLSSQNRRTI